MFAPLQWSGRKRWNRCLLASLAFHCIVIVFLIYHGAPISVMPSDADLGVSRSSGSVSIVYLAPLGAEKPNPSPDEQKPSLRVILAKKPVPPKTEASHRQTERPTRSDGGEQTARGGSPWGRVPGSPLTGDEVVPALPEVFPDPPVSRADLPAGIEGDVIVEVTIDSQGNVVETRLLQGIGYGIEQKVLTVLQRWHFRPAMRDGVTIASQHIVHFHYPG